MSIYWDKKRLAKLKLLNLELGTKFNLHCVLSVSEKDYTDWVERHRVKPVKGLLAAWKSNRVGYNTLWCYMNVWHYMDDIVFDGEYWKDCPDIYAGDLDAVLTLGARLVVPSGLPLIHLPHEKILPPERKHVLDKRKKTVSA